MAERTGEPNVLRWLQAAVFLVSAPLFMITLMMPIYGRQIGAGIVDIGIFYSIFFLVVVIVRPMVGRGVDRYGRRPFFLAGMVVHVLAFFVFAFIGQVWGLIAARALQGIASSLLWLAAYAITADVASTGARGGAFGRILQANTQGSIVGTVVGFGILNLSLRSPILYHGSWRDLFVLYSLMALVGLVIAYHGVSETRPRRPEGHRDRPIVWSRPWVTLLLASAVTVGSYTMLIPILVIYMQDRMSASIEVLAITVLPAAILWALLPSWLGRLTDRVGRKPLMVLSLLAAGLGSIALPWSTSLLVLAALLAVQALAHAAGDPAVQALVADLTGLDQRGRAYGLYALATGLGATVGPMAGTWLYDAFGPRAPFYANGIVLALCALAVLLLLKIPAPVAVSAEP
jgi:MFS family permease